MDMPVDFGLLAFCAVFGPRRDVSVDSCPHKPGTQKTFCGQSAGVGDVVDAVEKRRGGVPAAPAAATPLWMCRRPACGCLPSEKKWLVLWGQR